MAIATYQDLKDSVQDWLNRNDQQTINQIPNFINFAEKELHRNLRIPPFEGGAVVTVTNGAFRVPTDLIEFINLIVPYQGVLHQTSIDDLFNSKMSFTRMANLGFVSPDIPNGTKINITYYIDQEELKKDDDSSILLEVAPELLLYTSLKHAATYAQDEEDIQKYTMLAQSAYQQLVEQNEQLKYSGSPIAIPSPVLD